MEIMWFGMMSESMRNQNAEIWVSTFPFRDPVWHHHVERGEPVGGHEQKFPVHLVDVADLPRPSSFKPESVVSTTVACVTLEPP